MMLLAAMKVRGMFAAPTIPITALAEGAGRCSMLPANYSTYQGLWMEEIPYFGKIIFRCRNTRHPFDKKESPKSIYFLGTSISKMFFRTN
jgi:hypothetical protein